MLWKHALYLGPELTLDYLGWKYLLYLNCAYRAGIVISNIELGEKEMTDLVFLERSVEHLVAVGDYLKDFHIGLSLKHNHSILVKIMANCYEQTKMKAGCM